MKQAWYKCVKCNCTTNAEPGSEMYVGPCEIGGNCDRRREPSETELKQENERLKARILRLEERIAQLSEPKGSDWAS